MKEFKVTVEIEFTQTFAANSEDEALDLAIKVLKEDFTEWKSIVVYADPDRQRAVFAGRRLK